jgi:hypothetical protein
MPALSSFTEVRARAASYDNMKTVVESVFVGKDHQFNRRFL